MSSGFSRLTARLTPAVKWFIGVELAAFIVVLFAGRAFQAQVLEWLVLTPAALLQGHVWKLATTVLFPTSPITLIFDILILWFFMPFLERDWGTRRFVRFAAIVLLVGNLVSAAFGLLLGGGHLLVPIAGITPFVYAAVIATGTEYAHQPIALFGVVNMKGKTLAIGIAVLVVAGMFIGRTWVQSAGYIAAMGAAWLLSTRHFTPRLWILKWRRDRLRRRYTVLDGGRGSKSEKSQKKWLN